jgi:hypothetical protein
MQKKIGNAWAVTRRFANLGASGNAFARWGFTLLHGVLVFFTGLASWTTFLWVSSFRAAAHALRHFRLASRIFS